MSITKLAATTPLLEPVNVNSKDNRLVLFNLTTSAGSQQVCNSQGLWKSTLNTFYYPLSLLRPRATVVDGVMAS